MFVKYFILTTILPLNYASDIESCSDLIDVPQLTKTYYCDNFLISSLTTQLLNRRKLNKYLKLKLDHFTENIDQVCYPKKDHLENETDNQSTCQKQILYESCDKAIGNGPGIYLIQPPLIDIKPFMTYCIKDRDGGAAWTVIQRRIDNYTSFNVPLIKYAMGFGDISRSFWLGLDKLYAITHNLQYELYIELRDKNDETHYAKYAHFAIGGPDVKYALYVLGKYSGNLGDSLRAHEGGKFSTPSQINEGDSNCIKKKNGGWWFSGETCGTCHLNADSDKTYWAHWKKDETGFEEIVMAIREIENTIG